MNKNLARIILISAGFIWGFGFIANKYILDNGWDYSQLLFVRFMVATISIFIIFNKRIRNTDKETIKAGLFLGIFLFLGYFFQTWGLAHTTASNNALITAAYIFMMPIIIYIFDKKRVGNQTILAGIIVMLGISLISVDFKELTIAIGDFLTFIGAFFYAFHIFFLGKKAKQKDPYVLMAFQLLIFTVFATINMVIFSGLPKNILSSDLNIRVLLAAVGIGFLGSFIGFVLQSVGQKYANEAEAAILISTESLFGPILAILFYNDPFNIYIFFGIILVFFGIVLSETDIKKMKMMKKNNRKKIEYIEEK
ncbi:MAG: DMT family transporter [Acholeplasmataceae bacterium]|nr:DMT family transporter [Acholeplasmataceae bacterium]